MVDNFFSPLGEFEPELKLPTTLREAFIWSQILRISLRNNQCKWLFIWPQWKSSRIHNDITWQASWHYDMRLHDFEDYFKVGMRLELPLLKGIGRNIHWVTSFEISEQVGALVSWSRQLQFCIYRVLRGCRCHMYFHLYRFMLPDASYNCSWV